MTDEVRHCRSFDGFCRTFSAEFNPDGRPIALDTDLYDELGLDSLSAFRLVLFCETLAGADFPPDTIPPIFTVGDAYDYYRHLVLVGPE